MEYKPSLERQEAMNQLFSNEKIQKALAFIKEDNENTIAQQIELTKIPAPTFHEANKAAKLAEMFKEAGLTKILLVKWQ